MQDNKEIITQFIQQKGPCLPSHVYKELDTNVLFASAMLGELVSSGVLKVTNLKHGSSPYYYLEEHKDRLQEIAHLLNDKDKRAYALIKEREILNDAEQQPLMRVSLRAIKDFAVPLQIGYKGKNYFFWKWYMISDQEAEKKIKSIMGIVIENPPEKEEQRRLGPVVEEKKEEAPVYEPEQKREKRIQKKKEVDTSQKMDIPLLKQLEEHFKKNNITIVEQELMNKKGTEVDMIIELPSAVGKLQYYCKAKSKKRINDADIASAVVQGQQRRLPTLVIITGEMTKKSQEMMNKEFKGTTVQKI